MTPGVIKYHSKWTLRGLHTITLLCEAWWYQAQPLAWRICIIFMQSRGVFRELLALLATNAFEEVYRQGVAKKALYYVSYIISTLENVDAVYPWT